MLSYICFLTITVIATLFFDWEGIYQIALAASTAGLFFALADLTNWYISCLFPYSEVFSEGLHSLKELALAVESAHNRVKQSAKESIDLLQPYASKDERLVRIIQSCKDLFESFKGRDDDVNKCVDEVEKLRIKADKVIRRGKIYHFIEMVLASLGFLAFFILNSFEKIVAVVKPYEATITVTAFIVIMMCYYLRDTIEEKVKKKCGEMRVDIETRQCEIEELQKDDRGKKLWESAHNLSVELSKVKQQEDIDSGTAGPE